MTVRTVNGHAKLFSALNPDRLPRQSRPVDAASSYQRLPLPDRLAAALNSLDKPLDLAASPLRQLHPCFELADQNLSRRVHAKD